MPAAPSSTQPPRRRRRWLRWTLLVLGILVVAFLVLLRPIVFYVARYYADKFGRSENLKIGYVPGGNVWSTFTIDRAQVTPTAPGAVREAKMGRFAVHYSLWTLLRSGLG